MTINRRFVLAVTTIAVLATGSVLVSAFNQSEPSSLYRPELKREMTREQRWTLDFEMANELTSQVGSRRFSGPDGIHKRTQWFQKEAMTYQIADLTQQIMDVTYSKARNNENAFNQLVELGQQGDESASCMANQLYQFHRKEDTTHWKYSRDEVTRLALKAKASSRHPVCAGMESRFYLLGDMGYPKDFDRAKPFAIEGAVAGFFGFQGYLAATHLIKGEVIDPKEVELQLCWKRVADQFSPASGFYEACGMYQSGPAFNQDVKPVEVPQHIKELANKWCKPTQEQWKVAAQDCASLENK